MALDHKIFHLSHFQLHPIPQRAQGPLGQNWAKSGMPGQALAIIGYFLGKNGWKWPRTIKSFILSHFQLHPIPRRAQGPLGQHWAKSGMPGQALAILGYFLYSNYSLCGTLSSYQKFQRTVKHFGSYSQQRKFRARSARFGPNLGQTGFSRKCFFRRMIGDH